MNGKFTKLRHETSRGLTQMKILLAQINPTVGDLKGNAEKIIKALTKFQCEIYVFPELCITGYIPQDLLLRKSFVLENLNTLKWIIEKSRGKTIILGFVDKEGDKLYNSAGIIHNMELNGIYHKQCLPNYHIFDEKRWFSAGNYSTVFRLHSKIIGVNICEDVWFKDICMNQKNAGAEMIINISASPYSEGKIKRVEDVVMERHKENKIPIIYVNQVGAQDGIVFYGHSMYVKNGKIISGRDFQDDFRVVEM